MYVYQHKKLNKQFSEKSIKVSYPTLMYILNCFSRKKIKPLENKMPFDPKYFWTNQTVEYLETVCLDYNARKQILLDCIKLNFSCAKYLIDCYLNGIYDWSERVDFNCYTWAIPFNHIIFCCSEPIILYLLDMCIEKKLTPILTHKCSKKTCSIHYLIGRRITNIVNRTLDICIEHNLDLECKSEYGFRAIDLICMYESYQPIKRIIDIYMEKGLLSHDAVSRQILRDHLNMNRDPNIQIVMSEYLDEIFCSEFTNANTNEFV